MARLVSLVAGVLAAASAAAEPGGPVAVTIEQRAGGEWGLRYELAAPARRLDLGPSLAARTRDWRVATKGVRVVAADGRDWLEPARANGRLAGVDIVIAPAPNNLDKDYETIAPLGPGGAVLYTGHFLPWSDGRRMEAALSVVPAKGAAVAAFGETSPRFDGWRSPYGHPAFIYVGPLRPRQGIAWEIVDPSLPGWIGEEISALTPSLFAWFETAFGESLDAPPDMFLAMGEAAEEGRLRYHGDALPGQFMITLSGGAWRAPDAAARALLARAGAHEAAHLFQAPARPSGPDVPDWIHEGAADALAVEALAALGRLAPEDARAAGERARAECEEELDGLPLDRAGRDGRWRAVYACGHALSLAAARAHNAQGSVALFWRDFIAAARAQGGYDLDLFLDLVAAGAGPDVAAEFARFQWTRHARPSRELLRLAERAARARAPT